MTISIEHLGPAHLVRVAAGVWFLAALCFEPLAIAVDDKPIPAKPTMSQLEAGGYSCGKLGSAGYECKKAGSSTYYCDLSGKICESAKPAKPKPRTKPQAPAPTDQPAHQ
jgi:hypothetical protein